MRTVTIDDSGWGSMLGGMMLTFHLSSPPQTWTKILPVRYFQAERFWENGCREALVDLYMKTILEIERIAGKQLHFYLCRGGVHNLPAERLRERGHKISRGIVTGHVQNVGEKEFARYLYEHFKFPHVYNINALTRLHGRQGHLSSMRVMMEWVAQDLDRMQWCKTGWRNWPVLFKEIQEMRNVGVHQTSGAVCAPVR